ncbi:MarR family winged helix-turn-helix transcriptional regulator [Halodesulfovibrio sp. MK-HDV]|jgi:DNA-binding MarR family transcriptional regulator|uniref:MarR family winged helix-turn-helix transcriptional regulator n=1 Tax=Halodesulfovibrio sp. MK-HDV TaxID=2599925 RepID=UPI00136D94B7|nr:MarR family transcriptional regulator [Halodesulfovibrio sp. MK-HDV]KAF1077083.1 Multidrug resistance operon repressor [Halodesulfovibrio sp. MK-HDV]
MNNKEETIKYMTGRLIRIINKHLRIEEQPIPISEGVELTSSEVHCLQAIGLNEGTNLKSIASVMGVSKSAVSQMVSKLEKKKLVRKDRALDNNKEFLAFLTDSGWEAFNIHQEFHERHMHNLLGRLDEFSDPQIASASAILAVVETVVDERMSEIFSRLK